MSLRRIGLPLAGLGVLIVSCIDPLTAPPCTSTTLSTASTSVDTVTLNTGLRYIETETGNGGLAEWCRAVAIHYDAYLLDGTKFDSSSLVGPLLFTPGVGDLIDGLEQGVVGMRVPGTRRLIISPSLGFGSEPRRDENGEIVVPANSTLVYDVKVISIGQ
jgi:FKBP-type peptidyl-prolyl cis-trans isomerase